MALPEIIQGGMGVGVSGYRLARAVSSAGQLGVVSGTALDILLSRRLQLGDPSGDLRRALAAFPYRAAAERVLARWFVEGGKAPDEPYRLTPLPRVDPAQETVELTMVANFAEVFLAREGHDRPVGINYLEKIQLPTLPAILGALLAGVGVVIMGAGIPRSIPGVLDALARGEPVTLPVNVSGGSGDVVTRLDPKEACGGELPALERPLFLPIVSSVTLAGVMSKKANGRIDGFVIEAPSAGGHNAPPRGVAVFDEAGQPVYGPRDNVDLESFRRLGLPFWLAGSQGGPGRLAAAQAQGAVGIQVGTAFAFCDESGIDPDVKQRVRDAVRAGTATVRTDARASPTGFPFKVLDLPGSAADKAVIAGRRRRCDLGYLRHAFMDADGTLGWRCPADTPAAFARLGGDPADCEGRLCVCNGLIATTGLGQVRRDGTAEAPLVTCGDDLESIRQFLRDDREGYSAADVLAVLLAVPAPHVVRV